MKYIKSKKNKERAATVTDLIDRFQAQQGMTNEDTETILTDFMSNLLHYAHQKKVDFETVWDRAQGHFASEWSGKE